MTETQKPSNSGTGIGCLVAIAMLCYGAYWLWQRADDAGWVHHDKLTVVIAKNWSVGEYKNCTQGIVPEKDEEPQLDCSSYTDAGEPKRFLVRFQGQTYHADLKDKASFIWRCKKNDGTDPAFSCDDQKIVRWDQNK